MTTAVRTLLESFDALTDAEREEVAVEILRRVPLSTGELGDDAQVEAADALFSARRGGGRGECQPLTAARCGLSIWEWSGRPVLASS